MRKSIANGTLTAELLEHQVRTCEIDIVDILLSNGCPYNDNIAEIAIEENSIEMLEVLHKHGCPFKQDVVLALTERLQQTVKYELSLVLYEFKFLIDLGCGP